MGFPSAVRTGSGFTFWIFSVFCNVDCQIVQLDTPSQVAAQCGENVKLMCNVSSSHQLDIKLFSWLATNRTRCEYGRDRTEQEFQCKTTKLENFHQTLSLTLHKVMPVNAGQYHCKLQCTLGAKFRTTMVTIQECKGTATSSIKNSHAECSFKGVYPRASVHWFQGDTNLTQSSSTEEKLDQRGLYHIWSVMDVKEEQLQQPYNCSLWIPSLRKYLSWQRLTAKRGRFSAGWPTVSPQRVSVLMVTLMQMLL